MGKALSGAGGGGSIGNANSSNTLVVNPIKKFTLLNYDSW